MSAESISRRRFVTACGSAAGAALLLPKPGGSRAQASIPFGAPADLVQLNSNESPYGLPPKALETLTRSGQDAARYPDREEEEARRAIARLHGVAPEQIVLGCGSSDILRMAGAAFLSADKTLVAAETTFEAVLLYAGVLRAPTKRVAMTPDFRHDLPAMAAACDAKTGVVYVCNPNNPTGTVVSRSDMAAFLDKVPTSVIVLVDEAYHHFAEDPRDVNALDFLKDHPNLVVARTFSKIYAMAGLRLGYGVATAANVEALGRQASWNNLNSAALSVARTLLSDPAFVPERKRMVDETRRWLYEQLGNDRRRSIPSQTNFLMIDVGGDVAPVIRAFRDRGLLVGRKFPSMPDWLRVSIGTRQEMERFVAGLREIVPPVASRYALRSREGTSASRKQAHGNGT